MCCWSKSSESNAEDTRIQKEKELLEKLLESKRREKEKAKTLQRKENFSSSLTDLQNLLEQIFSIKNNYSNDILNCQNIIKLINQKETNFSNLQNIFMANEIRNRIKNLNYLKDEKDKVEKHINYLNRKIIQLKQLIDKYNLFQENNNINNINFLNDSTYKDKMSEIKILEDEMNDKINNEKNINGNLIINKINSEIQNLTVFPTFIIEDSFYNTKSKIDIIYNKFLDKEKKIMTKSMNKYKGKIIDYISNNDKLSSISDIKDKIIHEIIINEKNLNFIQNKILKEIEIIEGDDEKCKINNLNILLVGRKGVGKTTLIKYILGSNCHYESIKDNDFIIYTSKEIKHIKIIEVKGVGYDKNSTPDNIYLKINDYINTKKNDNNDNYNNIIHCIWYCISGPRFERGENELFNKLQNVIKDNTIPIIFVFTKYEMKSIAEGMKNDLRKNRQIYNDFVIVLAKDMDIAGGDVIESFGKDELFEITLQKCTKALKSDMLNIMIKQISDYIENKLIKENEEIKIKIINEAENEFIQNYKDVLRDGDFIHYITNIFMNYLNEFYDKNKKIKNRNKNLLFKSDFISSIKNIYESYKNGIKDIINPIIKEKSKELINIQSNFEKESGNMNISNRRNLDEFKKTTTIFLKQNYYYIVQNYIINFLIAGKNNYLKVFFSLVAKELNSLIKSMINLQNTNKEGIIIRKQLEHCYKKKLESFSKINNINIEIDINDDKYELSNNLQSSSNDEYLENPVKNSDSFIYYKNKETKFKSIEELKIDTKIIILKDNEWKLLSSNLKEKIRKFMEEFNYQISSLKINKEDHTFNFLQNEIKRDLINFLDNNFNQYTNKIYSYYNNINSIIYFSDNEIEQIISNENMELFYELQIKDSLSKSAQNQNSIKLAHISVIVAGKAGVGKSTLINCMLKLGEKESAPEGIGNVITLETSTYTSKIYTFLNLTDTRGYELDQENQKFNPKKQKDEVMKNVSEKKKESVFVKIKNLWYYLIGENKLLNNNKFNDYFHCIWFCVKGNDIDNSEENALKELKKESNIPVIVVNTRAINKTEVELMKKKINNLFPDLKFIQVLARDAEIGLPKKKSEKTPEKKAKVVKHFGLDELLNLTIDTIKSMETNDIFNSVVKEYKAIEENRIPNIISDIEKNIINRIVETFINNYNHVLTDIEFEQYIYDLFEKFVMGLTFREEISQKTKLLFQGNQLKNFIQKYTSFYRKLSQDYLSNIIETKAFKFLDMQVEIEKEKNTSIIPKYKRNKEEFEELILAFYNNNFSYIAQKYFIYRIIKDTLEPLCKNIGQILIKKLNNFLSSNRIMEFYRNIYLKVFSDFEKEINKFRDNNGKIYN